MKTTVTRFLAGCALLGLVSSCAGSYKAIQPERVNRYQTYRSAPGEPVSFAYQFDALRVRGSNKKYIKKEYKKGYHVVAVRLTNNTAQSLDFSRDLILFYGDHPVSPTPARLAAKDMRQGVAIYLLYLLLGTARIGATTDPYTGTTSGGVPVPVGLGVAGGNMLGAGLANKHMREEFVRYDLENATIRPGETVYGILSLREPQVLPLRVELRNPAVAMPAPAQAPVVPAAPAATPAPTPPAPPQPVENGG